MITLFCDLDNTIIYSHRRKLNTEKLVAEMLNGTPQSYMTEKTFEFLSACRKISIIPVTTRTQGQYERLKTTMESLNCEYALILNGAVLIKNGAIDEEWLAESQKRIKGFEAEMEKAAELMERLEAHLKYRDDFIFYASVLNPKSIAEEIEGEIDTSQIHVFYDRRKVYCTPSVINKGSATARLKNLLKPELTIGVGDSMNDVSMLNFVDIPIVPQSLEPFITNPRKVVIPQSEILSDAVCDIIDRLIAQVDSG